MESLEFLLPHIRLSSLQYHSQNSEIVTIALHGWLDNANSFSPLMAVNNNHHVIAIDWPGHGHSQHRGVDASYQLLDYVYDLYALIEHHQWQKVNIIGHSLGAIVASIFTGTFPELVNKLVLIEALGAISSKPQETRDLLKKSIVNRYREQIKESSNKRYSSFEKAVLARTMASDFNSDIAKILVERSLLATDDGFKWRSDPRLKQLSPMRMVEQQALDLLSGIEHETLLILGENGYLSLRKTLSERMAVMPNLNVHTLAGGHHLHMEHPEPVWRLISQHLFK